MLAFLVLVVLLQAPAHLRWRRSTSPSPARPDALGAAAADVLRRQAGRLRGPAATTTSFGRGKIEDFTWKGLLDFATCTECGRCQSQCPAWNTEKPLSPKLLIMDLRDHAFAKAPYLLAGATRPRERRCRRPSVPAEAERPLVGDRRRLGGVIDPDVLWSCTTCGACVEQCPVDIEHVDHIVDMRRYQVLIESAFPSELGGRCSGTSRRKGNPWGMNASARLDWAADLPFEVRVVGADGEDRCPTTSSTCSGSAAPGRSRTARRRPPGPSPSCCTWPASSFAVLGEGETCTGDPARRSGNEFLFQMLAAAERRDAQRDRRQEDRRDLRRTASTPSRNEYPQLGGHYEVVHHTQLLGQAGRARAS